MAKIRGDKSAGDVLPGEIGETTTEFLVDDGAASPHRSLGGMPDQNNPTDTSAQATAQWPLERPAHNNPKAAIVIASNGVSWNCPHVPTAATAMATAIAILLRCSAFTELPQSIRTPCINRLSSAPSLLDV